MRRTGAPFWPNHDGNVMAAIVGGDAGWLPIAIVDGTAFHFRGLSPATYQVSAIRAETDARLLVATAALAATVYLASYGLIGIRLWQY